MGKFGIVRHEPIGEILHVGGIGIRAERTVRLLFNHSDAQAQCFLYQVKIAIGDLCHCQFPQKVRAALCAGTIGDATDCR